MRRIGSRWSLQYLLAAACATFSLFVIGLLSVPLGGVFFVIPLAAVTVVSLAVGFVPGLFTALLVTLGLVFGLPMQPSDWAVGELTSVSRLATFVFAAVVISAIGGRQRVIQMRLGRERAAATEAAAALRETGQALRDADRRKNEFLAMLSHELRNPLAPVRNGLYLLRKDAAPDPRTLRTLTIIDRQVAHLSRLIDDLLDVTRVGRGKITLHSACLDMARLLSHTVDDYRATLAEKKLGLQLELEPGVYPLVGDATRLAQVVGNLLNNAAKFTPAGGQVQVTLRRLGSDRLAIEVADDGIGLEPSMLERVFEPFTQADNSLDRSRGGLGLGLALVKGLVELHGGRVFASSEGRGRGSRFTIELPCEARCSAHAAPGPAAEDERARTVLIIEDNRDAADTMREALLLRNHRVEVAYDGAAGLSRARELRPDVVLCDIGLPALDGYGVAKAIRADEELAGTRLVAVTGYAQPEDQRRAFEAGFHRHVAKPASLETLERLIAETHAQA